MTTKPLQVGTRVSFVMSGRVVVAEVVENRGPIGVGGRELVRVAWDDQVTELPREELRVLIDGRC